MTDQHLELLAQELSARQPLLTLSPAAVAAPVLTLLAVAVFRLLTAVF